VTRTTKGDIGGFKNPTRYIEVAKGEDGKHCCDERDKGGAGIPPLCHCKHYTIDNLEGQPTLKRW